MKVIARALISVSDKNGILDFAKALAEMNVEILSTGGTARLLMENALHVTQVENYTMFPEMMDGRVKTLHPKIHGGILAIRDNPKHVQAMQEHHILPIDMVVVNLYPFEQTIAKKNVTLGETIENIDIGGPSMLRSAAKNWNDVAVLTDPNDYGAVLEEMKSSNRGLSRQTRFYLSKKAFLRTAQYDTAIATHLYALDEEFQPKEFSELLGCQFHKVQDLRYGENPHQHAAFYRESLFTEPCITSARQLHGKELSYNNILDADGAIELTKEFSDHVAVTIIKHTNPCGVGISERSLQEAFERAKSCDSVSAFGGIVCATREINGETASLLSQIFLEIIIAPAFSDSAFRILSQKKNVRLLELPGLDKHHFRSGRMMRSVVGGLLVQDRDVIPFDSADTKVVTARKPTESEWKGLAFAWKVAKHVKSNAIVLANDCQTVGVGAGQMSRVDSTRIAAMKMRDSGLKGNFLAVASDAFYPFRDGIDQAANAGATAIIQPGGSIKDDEVIQAANERGIAMVFTGVRHFKH